MFSMLPTPAHKQIQSQHYTPVHPSPLSSSPLRQPPSALSPRDTNIMSFDPMLSPTPAPEKTPSTTISRLSLSSSTLVSKFAKRVTKPNPLLHRGNEDGRETRRKLFLKKVKEGAEEKRWQNRGGDEEMMRAVWILEERRRGEKMRREAEDVVEEEDEVSLDDTMVEEVAWREEAELEAILRDMPNLQMTTTGQLRRGYRQDGGETPPYGSDDEEYDDIFMNVIQGEIRMSREPEQSRQEQPRQMDQDMMDMS